MRTPTGREYAFVRYLESLVSAGDRGALAALRRALNRPPGSVAEADRHVFTHLASDTPPWEVDRYHTLAALFAYWYQGKHELQQCSGNMGVSLRLAVDSEVATGRTPEQVERRFERRLMALLNSHRDDLPHHLRHIVGLLRSRDVPVDWSQLLHDLAAWGAESRSVQRSWASSFWSWRPRQDERVKVAGSGEVSENETEGGK